MFVCMEGTFVHRKTGFGGQNNKDKAVVHGKGLWGGQSAMNTTVVHGRGGLGWTKCIKKNACPQNASFLWTCFCLEAHTTTSWQSKAKVDHGLLVFIFPCLDVSALVDPDEL